MPPRRHASCFESLPGAERPSIIATGNDTCRAAGIRSELDDFVADARCTLFIACSQALYDVTSSPHHAVPFLFAYQLHDALVCLHMQALWLSTHAVLGTMPKPRGPQTADNVRASHDGTCDIDTLYNMWHNPAKDELAEVLGF